MAPEELAGCEKLLAAERHLQATVPGAVLVGDTAAALHAEHRKSLDGDHVLEDLRGHFDEPEPLGGRRRLIAPWKDWTHLSARGRHWARVLTGTALARGPPDGKA